MTNSSSVKPILIGISGPSCSGKTTLSRVLKSIIPGTIVLHEDDFYKTDSAIPLKNGVQDWDCLDSIDLPLLTFTLRSFKDTGTVPSKFLHEEEDKEKKVSELENLQSTIASQRSSIKASLHQLEGKQPFSIAIIEGFLLYSEDFSHVRDLLDIKIFLRLDYPTMKKRRGDRKGYATIEGFWEDPPGYVDDVVWPNYIKDHAFLFEEGDVEGAVDEEVCRRLRIRTAPKDAASDIKSLTEWTCEIINADIINTADWDASIDQPQEHHHLRMLLLPE